MIALPFRTVHGFVLLDDPDARVTHAVLARPRVARRADGSPRLRLLRWARTAGDSGPAPGALLTLDVDIAPSNDELLQAGLAGASALPPPWLDVTARLEGPGFAPVEAPVSAASPTTVAMSVDLSPEAAAVLAPLLAASTVSPLQAVWTGHVLVRLPAVSVRASADVHEIERRMTRVSGDTISTLTRSIVDANARIEIRGSANAELEHVLREWVLDQLTERLQRRQPLEVQASASDVVRWPLRLAAALDDATFAGYRDRLVETVLLDPSEVGHGQPMAIRVLADFASQFERVDVQVESPAGLLRDVSISDQSPRLVPHDVRGGRWRVRKKRPHLTAESWSAWTGLDGPSLLIPMAADGPRTLEVVASGLDFARRWASVQLWFAPFADDGPAAAPAVTLSAGHERDVWNLPDEPAQSGLAVRLRFVSRQGQVVERELARVSGPSLVVTDPVAGARAHVSLLPAGTGWADVAMAMVDVRYSDGAFSTEEAVELRSADDFVEWETPARDDGPRIVEWRLHASYRDGRFAETPWAQAETGVIVVRLDREARRSIQIFPVGFDPSRVSRGVVSLHGAGTTRTVEVRDGRPLSVELPAGPFTWSVVWTRVDGSTLEATTPLDGDDVLVLPAVR